MTNLFKKYREVLLYIFFGGLTTAVNVVSYAVFARVFIGTSIVPVSAAWIISVAFAYITNKIWVFESRGWKPAFVLREAALFVGARTFSGAADVAIMFAFADVLGFNDILIKVLSNVIVVVLNYVFSKLLIFNKK